MHALALALLLPAVAGGPAKDLPTGGAVLATLDEAEVTEQTLQTILASVPPLQAQGLMANRDAVLGQMALTTHLYEEAVDAGFHKDKTVRAQVALAVQQRLAQLWAEERARRSVTDREVVEIYRQRTEGQTRPEVRARHILVKEEALAVDLMAQLQGGADFVTLANQHTVDPSGQGTGGDLDWFHAGKMVPAFSEAAFGAEVGEVVGPVKTQFGFHLIRVDEKRDQPPLSEEGPLIRAELESESMQRQLSELQSKVVLP
jgi:peptidyl-prolyl cis-trans isomerase C